MRPHPVVAMHQVIANAPFSLLNRHIIHWGHPLGFQASKYTLHRRVVVATAPATHALADAVPPQALAKVATSICDPDPNETAALRASRVARKQYPEPWSPSQHPGFLATPSPLSGEHKDHNPESGQDTQATIVSTATSEISRGYAEPDPSGRRHTRKTKNMKKNYLT